jgi:hypothetical protein
MRVVKGIGIAALGLLTAAAPPHDKVRRLSDSDLRRYAASKFDARKMMFRHEVIGRYRGTLVVADFPCGDVCPQYTRRIIHFAVDPDSCARVAGAVVVEEIVPRGIAVHRQAYCEPRIIAKLKPGG